MARESSAGSDEWGACVVGASTGGLSAVSRVLAGLRAGFAVPVVVLLHVGSDSGGYFVEILANSCSRPVRFAEEKLSIERGTVYVGSPGYHLLVEDEETFSFSLEPPVNFSRPSIDVLFESAADLWRERLIGILLTGANTDGAMGARRIRQRGGYVIVQDPSEAEAGRMPRAAIEADAVDEVLPVDEIGPRLDALARAGPNTSRFRRLGRKTV